MLGVIGAYSFLGPKAGRAIFDIPGETADLVFGGVTVLTGILGTLFGGIALDRMGSGVTNALIICAVCMAFGQAQPSRSLHTAGFSSLQK